MSARAARELLLGLVEEALSGRGGDLVCLEAPEWPPLPASLRRELDGRSVYTRPGVARYATAAQLRLEYRRIGAQTPRGQVAGQPRRALGLRMRDEPFFERQLRGGGVPRGTGPRVDAAPVQFPAQRRGQRWPFRRLQAYHLPGPAGQGLAGQAEQQLQDFFRAHLPGFRRHDQGELLEQVVPGPGWVLV